MIIYLQMIDTPEERSKFEKLYYAYRGLMFHVARQVLNNDQDAEDAVSSAFIKIAENIEKITDPVCPKTRGFVVVIVENTAIDMYRKLRRHPNEELNEKSLGISVKYAGDNELALCILGLPAEYRNIILLRYYYGCNLSDIAKWLGISYAAASKRQQRAKKMLEEMCRAEGLL